MVGNISKERVLVHMSQTLNEGLELPTWLSIYHHCLEHILVIWLSFYVYVLSKQEKQTKGMEGESSKQIKKNKWAREGENSITVESETMCIRGQ